MFSGGACPACFDVPRHAGRAPPLDDDRNDQNSMKRQDATIEETANDRAAVCLDPTVPLEELIAQATALTRRHFARTEGGGHRVLLYAPLYLSSHCTNHCVYCGFRGPATIRRRHLDLDEATRQADILRERGLRHILLVAGDAPKLTTTDYFAEMIRMLADRGIAPASENARSPLRRFATGSWRA